MGLGWLTGGLGSVTAGLGCDAAELGWILGLCCWAMGLCFSELGADGGLLISGIQREGRSMRHLIITCAFKLYLAKEKSFMMLKHA